ncbi:MAG TPA: fasciclin domain-containing protein [Candidatus Limnocylindrales bacterium]|jgi:uncharacterized surface protein with fasciclin (FAS1) repeats|nr:fasciclin domain-containing protein [Candidatus Limnocylindrales bacterium]
MMKHKYSFLVLLLISAAALLAADKNPVVGGQEMLPTNTIYANLSKSADHTTFMSAIKAAGLEDQLKAAGPITVFAPTNQAFADMPKGTFENLMKPENKEQLKKLLLYNMASGKWTTSDLKKKIKESKEATAEIAALQGGKLTLKDHSGMHLMVQSEDDDIGMFNVSDVLCSNGVIHVIDNVMMPKQ